jgi:hypothetical protein
VLAWLAAVIGAIVLGTTGGGKTSSLTIPGTRRSRAAWMVREVRRRRRLRMVDR